MSEQRAELSQINNSMMTAAYEFFLSYKSKQDREFLQQQYIQSAAFLSRLIQYGNERKESSVDSPDTAANQLLIFLEGLRVLGLSTVKVVVQAISQNGDANTIYTSKANLAGWMNTDSSLHTGEFSNEINTSTNVKVVTTADKRAALESSAVSNRSSVVMNQIIGIVIGVLLIYLILLLNFQDSTRDMRILRLLGYKSAGISRLLIDVYRPLLVLLYIITLPVAVFITERILRILSLQTGESRDDSLTELL